MELYKNENELKNAIIYSSNKLKMNLAIVEKDYYVYLLLKYLNNAIPGLLFKGGTCLSKCFKIIDRFSEDIDLSLDQNHYSQKNKRDANKEIISICQKLGFQIINLKEVELHSHGNYNCYLIKYPCIFNDSSITPYIKIEMTYLVRSYPVIMKSTDSLIYQSVIKEIKEDYIINNSLEPFEIEVQSLERTFIDKVFAICDYYLSNEVLRQSRHIYDIYKIIKIINLNNIEELISDVRNERSHNPKCLSAQKNIFVSQVLNNIVDSEYYKKDYEDVTKKLLINNIEYEEAISVIKEIAIKNIFK